MKTCINTIASSAYIDDHAGRNHHAVHHHARAWPHVLVHHVGSSHHQRFGQVSRQDELFLICNSI